MNLAMSYSFSKPNWDELKFPAHFKIDYIREWARRARGELTEVWVLMLPASSACSAGIYQPEGEENVGCDPKDHPTSEYIQRHWEAVSGVFGCVEAPSLTPSRIRSIPIRT